MRFLPALALTLALAACQNGDSSFEYAPADDAGPAVVAEADLAAPAPASSSEDQVAVSQNVVPVRTVQDTSLARRAPILIRRATLDLRVSDYVDAAASVPKIVRRFDAYLAGEQESRQPYRVTNTYTIRVAAAQFDSLMAELVGLAAEVEGRTVETDDVTEEYVDVEGRLTARRAVEAQYVTLLGRATNVEEVLRVQQALAQVREEVESAEGRLRFLRDRAALSTITLTLFEASPTGIAAGPGFFRRVAEAFGGGWEALLALIVGAVALWPLWLLVGLVAAGYRSWRRKNPRAARVPHRAARPADPEV